MCSYYILWINQLNTRDINVEWLSLMALGIVLGWELRKYVIPSQLQRWGTVLYILGGIALYLVTVWMLMES